MRGSQSGFLLALGVALSTVVGAAGCAGAQASCNQMPASGGGQCSEYYGAPSDALNTFMDTCGRVSGTWTTSGCTRAGSVGECRTTVLTATMVQVHYSGDPAALRSGCAAAGGTWSGP